MHEIDCPGDSPHAVPIAVISDAVLSSWLRGLIRLNLLILIKNPKIGQSFTRDTGSVIRGYNRKIGAVGCSFHGSERPGGVFFAISKRSRATFPPFLAVTHGI
ncbi:MAG: hypothetical protein AAF414_07900 [Pseudomonadota bacterium]